MPNHTHTTAIQSTNECTTLLPIVILRAMPNHTEIFKHASTCCCVFALIGINLNVHQHKFSNLRKTFLLDLGVLNYKRVPFVSTYMT
jgi:hypothetical protein